MPNPKRRHSKERTSTRRAHDFIKAWGMSVCQSCGEPKLPHRLCMKCGKYLGREVVEIAEA